MDAPRAGPAGAGRAAVAAAGGEVARRVATVLACAAAALLFPGSAAFPDGMLPSLALRGVLAGLVAGLSPARPGPAAACAAVGALLGALPLAPRLPGIAPWAWLALGVTLAAAAAAGFASARARLSRGVVIAAALAVVAAAYAWTTGLAAGPYAPLLEQRREVYARPPAPELYAFDGEIYLRTRDLMKRGAPYYPAFQQAWSEDARFEGRIGSPLSFREPALFELWRALPGAGGDALLGWFAGFALLAALAGWWLAAAYAGEGAALLAPIGLLSFAASFVLAPRSWFTFAEVWAAGALLAALALLARGRWVASALALVAAVAIRELAILSVPAWVAAWALSGGRRARLPGLAIAVAGSCVPVLVHLATAPAAAPGPGLAIGTWLHSTGPPRLVRALQFGMGLSPYGLLLGPLAAPLALAGAWTLRDRAMRGALAAAVVAPAAFLAAVSADPFDYYWGAILTPVLLAIAPLALARWLPAGALNAAAPPPGTGAGPSAARSRR